MDGLTLEKKVMKASCQPIFIVGAPRSGTTWLLSMLERHPQCRVVTPEDLGFATPRPTKETGLFMHELSSNEIIERFSRLPTDKVPVEKTPGHLLQAGRIKRTFPAARIILIRRQPLDVIWSMLQANTFWEESPRNLADAVALYNKYVKAQEIYLGYDAIVDYETLWYQPAEQLGTLLAQLGLDPTTAPQLIMQTAEGISLPGELSSVFRQGTPGEGERYFQEADKAYLRDNLCPPCTQTKETVLFTSNHLLGWTGSETLLMTLVGGLLERGYPLAVYARHCDQHWLDAHFDPRIRLTDDLSTLQDVPFDLAHIQHSSCLLEVRATFPALPTIFSSLGVLPFLEQPPPFNLGVSRYLAISEEVCDNLTRQGAPRQEIHVLRNTVNDRQFFPTSQICEHPERILVLSYKMAETNKDLLRQVAGRIGAAIHFVGSDAVTPNTQLNSLINEADVVVSLGRGVIEAMLCGRVPLVYDTHGGDGLVTPENIYELWTCNFSGRRYRQEYSVDALVEELGNYRQEHGSRLRELAVTHFGLQANLDHLASLYRNIPSTSLPPKLETQAALEFFFLIAGEDRRLTKQRLHTLSSMAHSQQALQTEIARVKSTLSWKITKPFRAIWNGLLLLLSAQR